MLTSISSTCKIACLGHNKVKHLYRLTNVPCQNMWTSLNHPTV